MSSRYICKQVLSIWDLDLCVQGPIGDQKPLHKISNQRVEYEHSLSKNEGGGGVRVTSNNTEFQVYSTLTFCSKVIHVYLYSKTFVIIYTR